MAQGYRKKKVFPKNSKRWRRQFSLTWRRIVFLLCALWIYGVWAVNFSPFATISAVSPAPSPTPTITPQPYWNPDIIFEHRDYAISITSAGDVIISETWVVRFNAYDLPIIGAELILDLSHITGIEFSTSSHGADSPTTITGASFSPDPQGNYQARARWHFSQTTPGIRYFVVTYTLHGALGISGKDAWFDWQFLGDIFDPDLIIKSSVMSVTLPDAFSAQTVRLNVVDQDQPSIATSIAANGLLTASATHLSTAHSLEMEVVFPHNLLTAHIQRPHWQKGNNPPQLATFGSLFSQEQVEFKQPDQFIGDPIPNTHTLLYSLINLGLWGLFVLFGLLVLYYIVTNVAGGLQERRRKATQNHHLDAT